MSPEQFTSLAARLKAEEGIDLKSNSGVVTATVKGFKITAGYVFDGAKFSVTILSKPFLFSIGFCESKMLVWLAGS